MSRHAEIGKRLKELRGSLSQKVFAAKIGVSYAAYQNYEYGKRMPPADVLSRIAEICNITIDWILTGVEDVEMVRRLESLRREHLMKELFARLEKVQAGARSTFTESRHAMKEFIERAEESIRRANELTYKRASGVAASERKRVGWSWRVEDKLFIQLLRKWLEEPGGSLCWMFEQLERIYNERDKIKLNAISAQLNALDPGENSKK